MLKTELTSYTDRREERSKYVADRFSEYLKNKVLDVGCYNAPLRNILNCQYTGIDIAGKPDITINLQETRQLPFQDNEFDCVICIDVLEHLDNLHQIFQELIRVSNKYIIISLPNCWRDARGKIEKGSGEFAHYGLQISPPLDRHRWFFNISQAYSFIKKQSEILGINTRECFVTEKKKSNTISFLRRLLYPGTKYLNRYSQTIWAVYEK